jgi:hypothetical protein
MDTNCDMLRALADLVHMDFFLKPLPNAQKYSKVLPKKAPRKSGLNWYCQRLESVLTLCHKGA